MNERRVPTVKKWPFYAADLLLAGLAILILNHYPHPLPSWPVTLLVGCVLAAAVFGVWPYLAEYRAAAKVAESDALTSVVGEIQNLQKVSEQVRLATGQWQGVQEQSARTVSAAREVGDKMAAEAHAFAEWMQKANDSEKATLRLEVEKLRRGENQWLHVLISLLDHVFALHQAGARSGQPNLEEQLSRFQEACRDIVRRVGLIPLEVTSNVPFDPEKHQLIEGEPVPPPDALVGQTLATGYSYQGQLLRRTLVSVGETVPQESPTETVEGATADDAPGATSDTQFDTLVVSETSASEDLASAEEQPFRLDSDGLVSESSDELRQA